MSKAVQWLNWLKNIRAVGRNDLHVANLLLDTQPEGASFTVETDVQQEPQAPKQVPDSNPNREEIELILQGKLILAIKEHRARTGYGLKESKVVIDNWRKRVGLPFGFTIDKLTPEMFGPIAKFTPSPFTG